MLADLGTSSCSCPSRLAVKSTEVKTTPMTWRPARFRLPTNPSSDRVATAHEHNRYRRGCGHGSLRRKNITDDDGHLAAHEIGRQPWKPIGLIVSPAKVDGNVLALDES